MYSRLTALHHALGVLLRKLESGLIGISHVIVDEVHERDINVRPLACKPCTMNYELAIIVITRAHMHTPYCCVQCSLVAMVMILVAGG